MRPSRLAAIVLSFVCVSGLSTAYASSIAMFAGPAFVNTSFEREQQNLRADLVFAGQVSLFTDTTGAAWTTALTGADILVIPSLKLGNLFGAMDAGARATAQSFVASGGGFIIVGDFGPYSTELMNGLFGFSVSPNEYVFEINEQDAGSTTFNASAAAGTAFAGGPATLVNRRGTLLVNGPSLPADALNLYHNGNQTSVFHARYGLGTITFLGYDWFTYGSPLDWRGLLYDAVDEAARVAAMPEPASLALLGTGLSALVIRARRRAKQR